MNLKNWTINRQRNVGSEKEKNVEEDAKDSSQNITQNIQTVNFLNGCVLMKLRIFRSVCWIPWAAFVLKVTITSWWKRSTLQNACFDPGLSWKQLDNQAKSFVLASNSVQWKWKNRQISQLTSMEQYLWNIRQQREVLCDKRVTVRQI